MKVTVHRAQNWKEIVGLLPTKLLDLIIKSGAHDPRIGMNLLGPIADERFRRRRLRNPSIKSNAEALEAFHQRYRPEIPARLTPSPGGRECLGNGNWPGYECCCDECDDYQICHVK